MSEICNNLHEVLKEGRRFDFSMGYTDIPLNGIYIMFEKGEYGHNGDRIVRIGTHTGDKQLRSRIFQHYENENKNRSIFRKNIGRCILNQKSDPYLSIWELDNTRKNEKAKNQNLINHKYEHEIEKEISKYIQDNLSFVILEIPTKELRLFFESRLIGTVSRCEECYPSQLWFGLQSPVKKIRESGLWQVMELYSQPLNYDELEQVKGYLLH